MHMQRKKWTTGRANCLFGRHGNWSNSLQAERATGAISGRGDQGGGDYGGAKTTLQLRREVRMRTTTKRPEQVAKSVVAVDDGVTAAEGRQRVGVVEGTSSQVCPCRRHGLRNSSDSEDDSRKA
jgi:hypothetical protein